MSKAAVRVWGETLRPELRRHGVRVSVICPGFVRSGMTDAAKAGRKGISMPFFWETDTAAAHIIAKLKEDCGTITFPLPMGLAAMLSNAMHPLARERLFRLVARS